MSTKSVGVVVVGVGVEILHKYIIHKYIHNNSDNSDNSTTQHTTHARPSLITSLYTTLYMSLSGNRRPSCPSYASHLFNSSYIENKLGHVTLEQWRVVGVDYLCSLLFTKDPIR